MKFKNSIKKFFLFIFVLTVTFSNLSSDVFALSTPPNVAADSVVLLDAVTGEILYEKNMHTAYPPASTTKIMTALLTLENCDLNEYVTVSKKCETVDGSKIYIFENEKIQVKDLLHALLLASANDCALALAEHIAGSEAAFAEMMNTRAKELGCENTNFVNPHGLYNKNHKTSAYDLASIMREVVKHPEYREISTTPAYLMAKTNKCKEKRPLWNGNRLIHKGEKPYYEHLEGGKTGYTIQSLHSYVASAKKGNQRLIAAFVHDGEKRFFTDAIHLFNYGFDNFELSKLYSKGQKVLDYPIDDTYMPLLASEDFYYVKKKDLDDSPLATVEDSNLSENIYKKGDYVIDAKINYNDKTWDLKLNSGINHYPDKNSLVVKVFSDSKKDNTETEPADKSFKKPLLYTVVLIVLFLILIRLRKVKQKRKRRKRMYLYDKEV